MAFEKFVLPGRGATPKISINGNGQVVFNRGAVKKFNIHNYKSVVFFYDNKEKKVGIKFGDDIKDEGACILNLKNNNAYAVVSGLAFLNYYEIKDAAKGRYDFVFDEKESMVIIDLNKKK